MFDWRNGNYRDVVCISATMPRHRDGRKVKQSKHMNLYSAFL